MTAVDAKLWRARGGGGGWRIVPKQRGGETRARWLYISPEGEFLYRAPTGARRFKERKGERPKHLLPGFLKGPAAGDDAAARQLRAERGGAPRVGRGGGGGARFGCRVGGGGSAAAAAADADDAAAAEAAKAAAARVAEAAEAAEAATEAEAEAAEAAAEAGGADARA